MTNISLLLERNQNSSNVSPKLILGKDPHIACRITGEIFDGESVRKAIENFNVILSKYGRAKYPIVFSCDSKTIRDKLSYVMLECLCYLIIAHYGKEVYFNWKIPELNMGVEGITMSPLWNLSNSELFKQKFEYDVSERHYRRIFDGLNNVATNKLSKLYGDVFSFLKSVPIAHECRAEMANVVGELVGNACEHSVTECLLDIDITNPYKLKESTERCIGINIAIVSFSDKLLGDDLKKQIETTSVHRTKRFKNLNRAYTYHREQFNDKYKETDFYMLSSFQDKISGHPDKQDVGGIGLTALIESLQEKSYGEFCYMITGDNAMHFIKNLLKYDDDKWLGFNESQNFFSDIPSDKVLDDCLIYMPGTAYSLNFAMKEDDS